MTVPIVYILSIINQYTDFTIAYITYIDTYSIIKEGLRKLNQTLRITHLWPPCGLRNSNNNSNISQHHTCRCPSAFVAETSAGMMLTIWVVQRVETDWTFSGLVQFPKTLFIHLKKSKYNLFIRYQELVQINIYSCSYNFIQVGYIL